MAYKNLLIHMKKLSLIIFSAIVLSGVLFSCNNCRGNQLGPYWSI